MAAADALDQCTTQVKDFVKYVHDSLSDRCVSASIKSRALPVGERVFFKDFTREDVLALSDLPFDENFLDMLKIRFSSVKPADKSLTAFNQTRPYTGFRPVAVLYSGRSYCDDDLF